MKKTKPLLLAQVVAGSACLLLATPSLAEMTASVNLSGQTGLIDMPSGDQLPDGYLALDHSRFGPITRNSLRFQLTPRISGTFRYLTIYDWNSNVCPPSCSGVDKFETYYDRNFDISYQILTEGRYRPAVTIGLQDFVGTGLASAEYIAATKTFAGRLKLTAGVGWGRLGSYNPIGAPFGSRTDVAIGSGGNVNAKQWFRGDMAAFGGLEYQINDKLTFKAEYSSDAYEVEAETRGTFERKSPVNFGLEYQPNPYLRVGGYFMYGTEVGFNLTYIINPDQRPVGGIGGPGPEPITVRPSRASDAEAWSTGWTEIEGAEPVLIDNLNRNLAGTGIVVESLGVTGTRAQVRFRNTKYDATAQAVGRVARAMTNSLPASVELFELVPVERGMAGAKVVMRRVDLENLEFAPDGGHGLRIRSDLVAGDAPMAGSVANPLAYPNYDWALLPAGRTLLFNPSNPFQFAGGLRLKGQYQPMPGLIFSGSVSQMVFSNIMKTRNPYDSPLQTVRSDSVYYLSEDNPGLETLTAAYYRQLAPELYGRVTAGYLETMFAGISTEALWRPYNRPWALGVEANYVAQRNTDGGLGLDQYDYRVATGHVSGYLDLGRGYHVQLDVGRYLAGDIGATLAISREFANGWKIGAFATKTNVSAEDFGEGSFDKGITLQIPLSWVTGKPTRTSNTVVIRPTGRDGGARLEVEGRLYDLLRSDDASKIDGQWGRVWK